VNVRRYWKGTAGGCIMFELGGTDCNYSLLLYWRLKIWFQLAREIGRSFLRVSVDLGPSLNVLISLYLQCPSMAAVRLVCCAAKFRPPQPSDLPPHRNEACACGRFLNKGLESFDTCPRHVQMTLEHTNKHNQKPTCGLRKRQADRPPTVSLRDKRTQIGLNLM
jgi:hypothetical protein